MKINEKKYHGTTNKKGKRDNLKNKVITTILQKQSKPRDMQIQTEFLQHSISIEFLPHGSDMPYRVFVSEDPIGFDGGDVNLYVYVGNNPINFTDPLGLKWKERAGRAIVSSIGAFWKVFGPHPRNIAGSIVKPLPRVGTVIMVLSPSELSDPYLGPGGRWYWPDGTPVDPNSPSPNDQPTYKGI